MKKVEDGRQEREESEWKVKPGKGLIKVLWYARSGLRGKKERGEMVRVGKKGEDGIDWEERRGDFNLRR